MACCIKGWNSRRERNESTKKSFFGACTNKSWHDILYNKSTEITKNSRIRELRFKPEDIKEDAFLQADGTVIHVKREKAKLKKGGYDWVTSLVSPTLFTIYVANLGETMRKNQKINLFTPTK